MLTKNVFIAAIALSMILIYGCSRGGSRLLEPGEQNGLRVEVSSWSGTFDPAGGFSLKIINNGSDVSDCEMAFDDKYRHSFVGLQNEGKGMVKDSVFRTGDTLNLTFIHEEPSNLLYFNVTDVNYKPSNLRIKCKECDLLWSFK